MAFKGGKLVSQAVVRWLGESYWEEPWNPSTVQAKIEGIKPEPKNIVASSCSTTSVNHSSVKLEDQATIQLERLTLCDGLPENQEPSIPRFDDGGAFTFCGPQNGHEMENSIPGTVTPGKRRPGSSIPAERKRCKIDDDMPSFLKGPQWACPMAKHNPERYEKVYNSCTDRKGLGPELKRVPEHLKMVHSSQTGHRKCRRRFYKKQQLDEHVASNDCEERKESLYDPEWLTSDQERVLKKGFDSGTSDVEKWRGYYQGLFPDDPKGKDVNPYYDYLTLTHRAPANGEEKAVPTSCEVAKTTSSPTLPPDLYLEGHLIETSPSERISLESTPQSSEYLSRASSSTTISKDNLVKQPGSILNTMSTVSQKPFDGITVRDSNGLDFEADLPSKVYEEYERLTGWEFDSPNGSVFEFKI